MSFESKWTDGPRINRENTAGKWSRVTDRRFRKGCKTLDFPDPNDQWHTFELSRLMTWVAVEAPGSAMNQALDFLLDQWYLGEVLRVHPDGFDSWT